MRAETPCTTTAPPASEQRSQFKLKRMIQKLNMIVYCKIARLQSYNIYARDSWMVKIEDLQMSRRGQNRQKFGRGEETNNTATMHCNKHHITFKTNRQNSSITWADFYVLRIWSTKDRIWSNERTFILWTSSYFTWEVGIAMICLRKWESGDLPQETEEKSEDGSCEETKSTSFQVRYKAPDIRAPAQQQAIDSFQWNSKTK